MEPARKPRLPLVIGLLLIAAGVWLLALFRSDPEGSLPGMPNAWKGGPMLLGAAFATIVGTFLLVQKKFSLAGFVLGGLVSAALAAVGNQCALSHRSVLVDDFEVDVPQGETEAFVQLATRRVTEERLTAMLQRLYRANELTVAPDFDGITINVGATSTGTTKVTLRYEFSPYLHARNRPIHKVASHYARMAIDVSAIEAAQAGRNPERGVTRWREHGGRAASGTALCMEAMSLSGNQHVDQIERIKRLMSMLDVLAEGENDASIKALFVELRGDFYAWMEQLKQNPFVIPTSAYPQASDAELE